MATAIMTAPELRMRVTLYAAKHYLFEERDGEWYAYRIEPDPPGPDDEGTGTSTVTYLGRHGQPERVPVDLVEAIKALDDGRRRG